MSVIKTDLLQNRLGTSHPAVTKADFIKVWWRGIYTAGVPSTQASLGTSTIVDGGVGTPTINFTTPFSSAIYTGVSAARFIGNFTGSFPYQDSATATQCGLNFYACPGVTVSVSSDPNYGNAIFAGDLA